MNTHQDATTVVDFARTPRGMLRGGVALTAVLLATMQPWPPRPRLRIRTFVGPRSVAAGQSCAITLVITDRVGTPVPAASVRLTASSGTLTQRGHTPAAQLLVTTAQDGTSSVRWHASGPVTPTTTIALLVLANSYRRARHSITIAVRPRP